MADIHYGGATYRTRAGESALDALIRGGADVRYSCRKGSCQTCALQLEDGDPGSGATKGLRPGLVEGGLILPCCAHPSGAISLKQPDYSQFFHEMMLAERRWLSGSVCQLSFEPAAEFSWLPGQFVNVRRDDGVTRSYSIASVADEDYFLSVHVKRVRDGVMSNWLCDDLEEGDVVQLQGPVGECYYAPSSSEQKLLLVATGSGLAPLYGICRDALLKGHRGEIYLYHGSSRLDGLYLRDELQALAEQHPNFHYHAAVTREPSVPPGVARGRVVQHAFEAHPEISGWQVLLCGAPAMVEEGRCQALLAGATRADIKADPFEYAHQYQPDDSAKIAAVAPAPELWKALEQGPKLLRILTSFYDKVYQDARLAPFFRRVTKRRAIGQQYAFLTDLFSGSRNFFGLKPFNAHHWMVIPDELFDYRERLMEATMREHGLDELSIRRWSAVHERFRREIVKGSPRGMMIDGVESPIPTADMVTLEIDNVCDNCEAEIPAGTTTRFNPNGGELFCAQCAGVASSQHGRA